MSTHPDPVKTLPVLSVIHLSSLKLYISALSEIPVLRVLTNESKLILLYPQPFVCSSPAWVMSALKWLIR